MNATWIERSVCITHTNYSLVNKWHIYYTYGCPSLAVLLHRQWFGSLQQQLATDRYSIGCRSEHSAWIGWKLGYAWDRNAAGFVLSWHAEANRRLKDTVMAYGQCGQPLRLKVLVTHIITLPDAIRFGLRSAFGIRDIITRCPVNAEISVASYTTRAWQDPIARCMKLPLAHRLRGLLSPSG